MTTPTPETTDQPAPAAVPVEQPPSPPAFVQAFALLFGSRTRALVTGCAILAIAAVCTWQSLADQGPTEAGAEQVCSDFVRDRLVSPASASFSGMSSSGSGKSWTVTGAVDSDNRLGASIRNRFTCRVEYLGDSRWELVSLTGLRN